MRSIRKNCIWKSFLGENKFSNLHFVSLLRAWVRIPPKTEFFSKLDKSILLSLLHNQHTKVHIFVRFNTSWYIANNLDDFLSFLITFQQKTYVETKQEKKKILLLWDLISGPLALQFTALPTELPCQEEKMCKEIKNYWISKIP